MPYGTIKVDNITFTDNSVDKTVSLSGLIQNPTFTGNVTVTGTISGDVIRGGTTISGVTVTGTTANFVSGVFTTQISGTTITGTTVAATTGNYTSLAGTTTTGTTANFVSGVFTTQVSGTTITGTTVATTTGSFVSLTGTTATFTSGIIASGTAALPSLAILLDPNTGIYSPGADQLAISTNGTGRLFIDASGSVGVGTTPAASVTLHVDASGGGVVRVSRISASAGAYGQLEHDGTNTTLNSTAATVFVNNSTERLRITSAGLVGIGTSSPAHLVHLRGGTATTLGFAIEPVGWSGLKHRFTVPVSGDNAVISCNYNGSAVDNSAQSTSSVTVGNGVVQLATGGTNAAPTTRLHVSAAGNVGIGTTSPDTALTVLKNSNADFSSQANLRTSSLVTFDNSQATTALVFKGITSNQDKFIFADNLGGTQSFGIGYQNGATRVNSINCTQNDAIVFNRSGSENGRWDSSGRLLVGTSSALNIEPFVAAQVQTEARYGYASIYRANDAGGPALYFIKSRAASAATVVQSGDVLGEIRFQGADGGDYETPGGTIKCEVDGTPGANDMPGRLVFSTTADGASSPTERMRITQAGATIYTASNGSVTLGNTDTAFLPDVNFGQYLRLGNTYGSGKSYVDFTYNGTSIGKISANSTSSVAYATSSDYRLKENVKPISGAAARILQLKPSRFNFIVDPDHTVDGFIAHEAQAVVPECVTGTKDAVDADGNPVFQGIDQSKLVPLLTAALQEAITEINALKDRLTAAGIA